MRITIAVAVALILGIAAGMWTASIRVNLVPWDGDPGGEIPPPMSVPAKRGDPRAVVDEKEHQFGLQDVNDKGEHDFTITNGGEGRLVLTKGKTSCGCTLSELDKTVLEPGESATVTITWTGKGYVGKFRQSATILTNDPAMPQIEFVVSGKITTVVQTIPSELVFSSIPAEEPTTGEIPVYCYLDEPFEIVSFKLADQDTAKHFQIAFEPLPEGMLKAEPEAKSGQLVKVTVDPTVEPGLRPGEFQQKILVATSLGPDGSLDIPIRGKVVGDISVVGPAGWHAEKNVLVWGTVDAQTGGERRLSLFVRGPYREEVKFKIARVFPESLKVELGEKKQLGESDMFQVPLTIQIPKGSRPVNHLGSGPSKIGEIVLDTNHPKSPQLLIRVSFIIKG